MAWRWPGPAEWDSLTGVASSVTETVLQQGTSCNQAMLAIGLCCVLGVCCPHVGHSMTVHLPTECAVLPYDVLLLCPQVENIGARRLHTVLERLVEDISFEAPDKVAEAEQAAAASPRSDSPSDVSGQASSSSGGGGGSKPGKIKKGKRSESTDDDVERLKQQLQSLDYGTRLQICEDEEMYAYTHIVDKQQVREKLQSLLQQDDLNKYIL